MDQIPGERDSQRRWLECQRRSCSEWTVDTVFNLNSPYFGDSVDLYDNTVLMGTNKDHWLYEKKAGNLEFVVGFSGQYDSASINLSLIHI